MKSRRDFLKLTGTAILAASITSPLAFASSEHQDKKDSYTLSHNKEALTAKRWGLVIDTRKLNEELNHKIQHACHKFHNVPEHKEKAHEIKWIWNEEYENAFVSLENDHLNDKLKDNPILVLCNHCENPPCVKACPTQATFKREADGLVLMDFHRCIGCRFCMAACPYGSRSFNFKDPRPAISEINKEFLTRTKGVVEKCNFCAERLAEGKAPLCVEASEGAIVFGDLDDPNSEIVNILKENYAIRRKAGLGTSPSVYYIV